MIVKHLFNLLQFNLLKIPVLSKEAFNWWQNNSRTFPPQNKMFFFFTFLAENVGS